MTAKEFFNLVAKMRKAQKEYFKTKAASTLKFARYYEDEVDKEIKRVQIIVEEKTNPKLDL